MAQTCAFLDRLSPGVRAWYEQKLQQQSSYLRRIKLELLSELDDLLDEQAATHAVQYVTHLCLRSQHPELGVQPVLPSNLAELGVLFAPDCDTTASDDRKHLCTLAGVEHEPQKQ